MERYLVFLMLTLFLLGCTGQEVVNDAQNTMNQQGQNMQQMEQEMEEEMQGMQQNMGQMMQSETKTFEMTAKKWKFEPSTITVNEGDHVVIKVTSLDVEHGFALPEFNINENLSPGETVTIEFDADKKGTFRFYCSVYCGSGHGEMDGTLIVQ